MENDTTRLANTGNLDVRCGTISLQSIICCEPLKSVKYCNQAKQSTLIVTINLQFMQFRAVDKHKTQSNHT